jgi:hypothetical protein
LLHDAVTSQDFDVFHQDQGTVSKPGGNMKAFVAMLFGVLFLLPLLTACEKGHYTEDRQYVGDPERVESASEATREQRQRR